MGPERETRWGSQPATSDRETQAGPETSTRGLRRMRSRSGSISDASRPVETCPNGASAARSDRPVAPSADPPEVEPATWPACPPPQAGPGTRVGESRIPGRWDCGIRRRKSAGDGSSGDTAGAAIEAPGSTSGIAERSPAARAISGTDAEARTAEATAGESATEALRASASDAGAIIDPCSPGDTVSKDRAATGTTTGPRRLELSAPPAVHPSGSDSPVGMATIPGDLLGGAPNGTSSTSDPADGSARKLAAAGEAGVASGVGAAGETFPPAVKRCSSLLLGSPGTHPVSGTIRGR